MINFIPGHRKGIPPGRHYRWVSEIGIAASHFALSAWHSSTMPL
jgi:hypothetical protein